MVIPNDFFKWYVCKGYDIYFDIFISSITNLKLSYSCFRLSKMLHTVVLLLLSSSGAIPGSALPYLK